MRPPGAPRSGLRSSVAVVPYELKDEMRPPVGFTTVTVPAVHVSVTGPEASRESISAPSVSEIATTGIVMAIWGGPAGG